MVQTTVRSITLQIGPLSDDGKPTTTLENLARLAAKPGVQSTLVLSKSDGSIIRSTGLLANSAIPQSSEASTNGNGLGQESNNSLATTLKNGTTFDEQKDGNDRGKTAEYIARLVFAFLAAANEFADGMENEDDTKLLRMRTRKNEIVIVPGQYALASLFANMRNSSLSLSTMRLKLDQVY
ncbi:MAG: hypothetical protein Q9225_007072 [Loekoesia sp. 1 TL-2023]